MQRINVAFTIFLFIWFALEVSAESMLAGEPTQPKEKPTIAVTTFENLSAFPENAWVAMSFSEALTTKLKRLYEHFRVVERLKIYEVIREQGVHPVEVNRLEAAKQKEMGTLIGANYLILGSVSLQGNADDSKTPLLANLRWVDVQTGEIKEAESVKGEMERLFELETQLAFALLKQMGIEPTPEEAEKLNLKETLSIIANKYYNLGQKAFYDGDYETAKSLFDKALEALGGQYYQAAELSLIEVLERQKAAADETQQAQIRAEARRRCEESERKRAEANQRLFAEAKYRMLAEDYELAVERFGQYLALAKPFRQLKWKQEFYWRFMYPPLLHEGVLYVALWGGDGRYRLCAIDPQTGAMRWEFKQGDERSFGYGGGEPLYHVSPIVVAEGIVVAPSNPPSHQTRLVTVDADTGKLLWEFAYGEADQSLGDEKGWTFPQVTEGVVCVKFDDGVLVALSARTGEKKWQRDTGLKGVNAFLASGGRVYLATRAGLLALSAQTGEELWRAKLDGLFTLRSPWARLNFMDKATIEGAFADYQAQFETVRPILTEAEAKAAEEEMKAAKAFIQGLNLDRSGVFVLQDDSEAGLKQGDVILAVDGTPISNYKQFIDVIRKPHPSPPLTPGPSPTRGEGREGEGQGVRGRTLTILREGEKKNITVEETDASLPEPEWNEPFFPPVVFAIQGDILYAGANGIDGSVAALKAATGEIVWEYRARLDIDGLALEGKYLYAYSQGASLSGDFVLGTESGELLWEAREKSSAAQERVYGPLLANERIYKLYEDWQPRVVGRTLETGKVIWRAKLPVWSSSLNAVTETTVYLSASDRLHVLDANTGEALWQLPIDGEVKDVLVGEDGTVYLTTKRARPWLYALSPKPKGTLPEQEEYESLLGVGTALVALGRYEEAIPKLKEALEQRVDLHEAHWQLMLAHEGLQQWREAANERDQYLENTPYPSARPEVKKHLYERFSIQKWASRGEADADIRRHFPDPFNQAYQTGMRWGGAPPPTVVETSKNGMIVFLKSIEDEYRFTEIGLPARYREWENVEELWQGQEWVKSQAESRVQEFSDGERFYVAFHLAEEMAHNENEAEYQNTAILGAYSKETGDLLWKFQTEPISAKVVSTSVLLLPDENAHKGKGGHKEPPLLCYWGVEGRLYALDKVTGALGWEFHDEAAPRLFTYGHSIEPSRIWGKGTSSSGGGTRKSLQTSLVAVGRAVYIVDQDGFFVLSADTGELVSSKLVFSEEKSLQASEEIVCIGTAEGVYAFDARTGLPKWELPIEGLFPRTPLRSGNGRVYTLAYSDPPYLPPGTSGSWPGKWTGYLYAIRADSGEVDWLLRIPFSTWVDNGIEYVPDSEAIYLKLHDVLYAVSAETGEVRWSFPYRSERFILGEETVYMMGDRLYALDKATGVVKWMDESNGWNWEGVESGGFLYLNGFRVAYAFDLAQINKLLAAEVRWWIPSPSGRGDGVRGKSRHHPNASPEDRRPHLLKERIGW